MDHIVQPTTHGTVIPAVFHVTHHLLLSLVNILWMLSYISLPLSLQEEQTWVLGFFKRLHKDVTDFLKQNSGQREIRVRRLIKVLWGQFKDWLSLSSRHEISIYLPCSLTLWRFPGHWRQLVDEMYNLLFQWNVSDFRKGGTLCKTSRNNSDTNGVHYRFILWVPGSDIQ